jgi:hypothetical protein
VYCYVAFSSQSWDILYFYFSCLCVCLCICVALQDCRSHKTGRWQWVGVLAMTNGGWGGRCSSPRYSHTRFYDGMGTCPAYRHKYLQLNQQHSGDFAPNPVLSFVLQCLVIHFVDQVIGNRKTILFSLFLVLLVNYATECGRSWERNGQKVY